MATQKLLREKHILVSQAAKMLGKPINTLRRWDRERKFRAKRLANGYRYYLESDLLALKKSLKKTKVLVQ